MGNKRILIVDDNISLHEDFRKVLVGDSNESINNLHKSEQELFGDMDRGVVRPGLRFDLEYATQGQEALQKVVSAYHEAKPFALVFMDVRMPPGWDGITTIAKIWEQAPDTEVVICTAYSDFSLDEIIKQLGISDRLLLLKKPFDSVEVQQMALALTAKWDLRHSLHQNTLNLATLVGERTRELDNERAKAVNGAKLMALGEMAGGIAHEINNPLSIIQLNARLLEEMAGGDLDVAMVKKLAGKVVDTTERIAKIIRGLRALSRSGEGDPVQTVPTAQLIEQTLGICREKFKTQDVNVKVENPYPFVTVDCREVQIIQVLLNLLNNAYDALEGVKEKWIRLEVREMGELVEFRVSDGGVGIPEAIAERIFVPFFTTKSANKGTGLGLGISRDIVEAHEGQLILDRTALNTCFVMRLPKKQKQNLKKAG